MTKGGLSYGSDSSGGYSTKFYARRLRPEFQPLTLSYTIFWTEKVPLSYTLYSLEKQYPFLIPSLELCIPFHCRECSL